MQLEVLLGTAVATPGDICDPFLLVHQCRGEVPFDLQLTVQLEVLFGTAVATPGDIYERSRRSLSLFSIHSHNQAVQAVSVVAFFRQLSIGWLLKQMKIQKRHR